MAVIGGDVRLIDDRLHRLVTVPADEVAAGDHVRDQGILKRIAFVEPSVVGLTLTWHFDPAEGCHDRLRVPSLQSVTVWQVQDAG